jgi:integrase/recombinase XerC
VNHTDNAAVEIVPAGHYHPAPAGPDPVALLLADKRSPATRRAYAGDLRAFFGGDPQPHQVRQFVALPVPQLALRLAEYKAELLATGAAEATINRRLAAVRSLLKLCHRVGLAQSDGSNLVDGEQARTYRDTRGVDVKTLVRLVKAPGVADLAGRRDTALLRVLCENALRRAEVCSLHVEDFSAPERRLFILGKGKGTQKEPVTVSSATVAAISLYLDSAGHVNGPLFRNVDHRTGGTGLTPGGLYYLIRAYGEKIGVPGLTPHKLRHSAITAALDATGGDVRKVQRFSRHAKLETLQRYDDNRADFQGQVSRQLSGLLG